MNPIYKRMLENMQQKKQKKETWCVYILECSDGTYYTGIAKDLQKRFKMHSEGKGAKYTRTRLPLKILYHENCPTRAKALIRECAVKALPRSKKTKLVESHL